jgi:hypothetical protein
VVIAQVYSGGTVECERTELTIVVDHALTGRARPALAYCA